MTAGARPRGSAAVVYINHNRACRTNGGTHSSQPLDQRAGVHPRQREPRPARRGYLHGHEPGAAAGGLGEHLRARGAGREARPPAPEAAPALAPARHPERAQLVPDGPHRRAHHRHHQLALHHHHPAVQVHCQPRCQDQVERLQLRRGPRVPRAVRVRGPRAHADEAQLRRLRGAARSGHRDGAQLHGEPECVCVCEGRG
jgi:hypothetical protein